MITSPGVALLTESENDTLTMIVNYWPGRSLCVWSHLTSRTAVPEHFVVAFYVLWNTTSSEVERMCECLHCNSFALGGHDIQNCDSLAGRSVKKERKKKMRKKKMAKGSYWSLPTDFFLHAMLPSKQATSTVIPRPSSHASYPTSCPPPHWTVLAVTARLLMIYDTCINHIC